MNNIVFMTVSSMSTLKKFVSNKVLLISTILGAGILLSAIFIVSPITQTWAQQQRVMNGSPYTFTNTYGVAIPKINGSVNVGENVKNLLKENMKIPFIAAAETAQKQIVNGTVLGGHVGVTQGYLTYTYLVVDPNKQTAHRIIIDAGNGKVLYTSQGQPIDSFGHSLPMFGPFGHGRGHGLFGVGYWHGGPFGYFGTFGPFGS